MGTTQFQLSSCTPEFFRFGYDSLATHEKIRSSFLKKETISAIIREANISRKEFKVSLSDYVEATLPFSECVVQDFIEMTYSYPGEEPDSSLSYYAKSLLGTKVSVTITSFSDASITVSRKQPLKQAYEEILKEKSNPNIVYKCMVLSLSSKAAFVDMGGGIVGLIPAVELSKVFYVNLRNWVEVGDVMWATPYNMPEDGRFVLSRKNFYAKNGEAEDFSEGDIIPVHIGNRVPGGDGYYVELTPGIAGIMDSPMRLYEGDVILALIKKKIPDAKVPCGFRFRLDFFYYDY